MLQKTNRSILAMNICLFMKIITAHKIPSSKTQIIQGSKIVECFYSIEQTTNTGHVTSNGEDSKAVQQDGDADLFADLR